MTIKNRIKYLLRSPVKTHRDMGDKLRVILPIITLYKTSSKKQFIKNLVFTQTVIEIFKNIAKRPRPDSTTLDNKSDNKSFPSGHAGAALLSGNYYYKCVNSQLLISKIIYLSGFYVSWTRVNAKKHYLTDIIGSYIVVESSIKNLFPP